MRVLLTGGSGFLGRHVLPLLRDHNVLCLSRNPDRLPSESGLTTIGADLTKDGEWIGAVARFRPEWCIHLAWEGLPDYSLARCRANLDASIRLIGALRDSGLTKMVVAGSCWEYGDASGAVIEDHHPDALGTFAATKRALQGVLDSVAREAGFQYRWARIFFVYGAGQRPTSLIPSVRSAYESGGLADVREPGVAQDFVHVEDVAAGLVALAVTDAPSGPFNIGSGQPIGVGQIANKVAEHYGRPRPFDDVAGRRGFWADTTKTSHATGWQARIGIDDGIRKTLAALDGRGPAMAGHYISQ